MKNNLFIGGKWKEGRRGKKFVTVNPATESEIMEVSLATPEDVDEAVNCASRALKGWAEMKLEKRRELILKVARMIRSKAEEIAKIEVQDSGATIRKALADVNLAVRHIKFFAEIFSSLATYEIKTIDTAPIKFSYVRREPVGVCAGIIPWNFPFLMAVWKTFPALVMGNTVVLKPAPQTPLSAILLAEIMEECEIPAGVFNVVTGDVEVGEAMVLHPAVNKISFTGSTEVGKRIMELASKGLKRLTLELGGKNPFIVLDDADLDMAIDGAIFANFYHCGQVCTSGSRVLVQEGIFEEFLKRLLQRVSAIKIGDPSELSTGMGPLISNEHRNKVKSYVEIGKREGAELVYGGEIPSNFTKGYYYMPTIFVNVQNTMKIAKDEIFGPVMSVLKFKTDTEVIEIANNSRYGLTGSVWSQNITRAASIARDLKAGTVWINEHHILDEKAPFGGFKESGIGRELGESGLIAYTEEKHIYTNLLSQRWLKVWYDALF